MIVSVNIKGSAGTVSGAGEFTDGETVDLLAMATPVTAFKHWVDGGVEVVDNPYSFVAGNEDKEIDVVFYMPVQLYLKNIIGFPITDEQIIAIMTARGIPYDADASSISQKQKDLAYADLIMLVVTTQSEGAEEDKMGNWSHRGKSKTITGRRDLVNLAKSIYSQYGISISNNRIKDITRRW